MLLLLLGSFFILNKLKIYIFFSLHAQWSEEEEESEEEGEDPALDSLSQAIAFQVQNWSMAYLLYFFNFNFLL